MPMRYIVPLRRSASLMSETCKMGSTSALRSLAHTLAALTTNCTDFGRAWNATHNTGSPGSGFDGRWEGEWISEANGHRGALRCVLSRIDESRYRAWFHA